VLDPLHIFRKIPKHTGLEELSAELFAEVVGCLPDLQDQLSLSLVSQLLYHKVIPYIYGEWEFHGYFHSFKSLYQFLRTIIEGPNLASLVHTLDIHEWDVKPSDRLAHDDSDYDIELDEDMDEDYRAQMA
jgi:hypothetical protein